MKDITLHMIAFEKEIRSFFLFPKTDAPLFLTSTLWLETVKVERKKREEEVTNLAIKCIL
jgi:hypothetical protein